MLAPLTNLIIPVFLAISNPQTIFPSSNHRFDVFDMLPVSGQGRLAVLDPEASRFYSNVEEYRGLTMFRQASYQFPDPRGRVLYSFLKFTKQDWISLFLTSERRVSAFLGILVSLGPLKVLGKLGFSGPLDPYSLQETTYDAVPSTEFIFYLTLLKKRSVVCGVYFLAQPAIAQPISSGYGQMLEWLVMPGLYFYNPKLAWKAWLSLGKASIAVAY